MSDRSSASHDVVFSDESALTDALLDTALDKIQRGEDLPMGFIGNVLTNCRYELGLLRDIAAAARDVFPENAGFWDSRRMHWIRTGLIELGVDPAPDVPRCDDLDGMVKPEWT